MPKANISGPKQALCVDYIRRSGLAYTLKDLEKLLPGISGISNVVVKDYCGSMADENLIRVEKIGSGNWYWSFMSDEAMKRENALAKAEEEKGRMEGVVEDLEERIEEAVAERVDDDEEMMEGSGGDRDSMTALHTDLGKALGVLKTELAGYAENDPVEVERRRVQISDDKGRIDELTDAICSMEGYLKNRLGMEKQFLMSLKQSLYGSEFDEEAGGLREI